MATPLEYSVIYTNNCVTITINMYKYNYILSCIVYIL